MMKSFLADGIIPPRCSPTIEEWRSLVSGDSGDAKTASTVHPPPSLLSKGLLPAAIVTDSSGCMKTKGGYRSLNVALDGKPGVDASQVYTHIGAELEHLSAQLEALLCCRGGGPETFQMLRAPFLPNSPYSYEDALSAIQNGAMRMKQKSQGVSVALMDEAEENFRAYVWANSSCGNLKPDFTGERERLDVYITRRGSCDWVVVYQ